MIRSRHCLLFALALLLLASAAAQPAVSPNIIFIHADDLGYGDLGCYGQQKLRTPNIDRLAAEGTRFTQYYAGSTVCAPSRSVLMTGLHTGHTYIRGNSKANFRPEDITVAEILKAAGYQTSIIGKWGLGHEGSGGVPTRKGFDYFFGYLDQTHAHNYFPTFLLRNEQRVALKNVVPNEGPQGQGVASVKAEFSHDLMSDDALKYLDQVRHPFFLYLAFTLPHANNEGKNDGMEVPDFGEFAGNDWPQPEKGFASMVSHLDQSVGAVMAKLKQRGLDSNTIVFFTSDNGPHKEGGHDADFFDSNGTLRGTKRDLYEGGIRVPMIVRWPGKVKAGAVSHQVWGHVDFLATAAALAKAKTPAGQDGISMLPAILGKRQRNHDFMYWEFHERAFSQAVRMGNWKAVRKGMNTPLELYDLAADIGENNNIAAQHPDIVKRIEEYLKTARTESDIWKIK